MANGSARISLASPGDYTVVSTDSARITYMASGFELPKSDGSSQWTTISESEYPAQARISFVYKDEEGNKTGEYKVSYNGVVYDHATAEDDLDQNYNSGSIIYIDPSDPYTILSQVTEQTRSQTRKYSQYKDLVFEWGSGLSGQSGTTTITGLSPGFAEQIQDRVTVTCTKEEADQERTQTRTREHFPGSGDNPGRYGSWSSWTSDDSSTTGDPIPTPGYPVGSAVSNTLIVYTKPKPWTWPLIADDEIIEFTLRTSDWENLRTQCQKYQSWKAQRQAMKMIPAVPENRLVTASLYNSAAQQCGVAQVTDGSNGTIIKAKLFTDLAHAVS